MKFSLSLGIFALVFLAAMPGMAMADSAANGWNSNMGFSTPSEEANAFNRAQALFLLRRGINPAITSVVNNMACKVAGSCQVGGTATNINGYVQNNIDGNGNNVTVDVDADADQRAVSTTANGEFNLNDINF